jgi:hypothetical protein
MSFSDRDSTDDFIAAKRLTLRHLAAAWSLALAAVGASAAVTLAELARAPERADAVISTATAAECDVAPPG